VKWLGLFMGGYYFIFFFMFLSSLAVSLLCILGQVTRRAFVTFMWCCVERGDLLSFLELLFVIIE
jgi:hypothetical protein